MHCVHSALLTVFVYTHAVGLYYSFAGLCSGHSAAEEEDGR